MGPKSSGRKDKLALKAAQLEAQKREQEEKEEEERLEQERLQRQEREREAKRKKEETEILEKSIRDKILQDTCDYFQELKADNFQNLLKIRDDQEWEKYVACDRLPYTNDVPSMNTYLFSWQAAEETGRMEMVFEKNEAMLALLSSLEDYIETPMDANERKVNNWKEVRENYREELRKKLDLACFYMIRDVERKFKKINYWESEFQKNSDNIHLWMWIWMTKRIFKSNSVSSLLKSLGPVTVKLPKSLYTSLLLLRVLHCDYDHYSDQCRTWEEPKNPIEHDLYDETTMWHNMKVEIIMENIQSLQNAEDIPCWFNSPEQPLTIEDYCESGVGLSEPESGSSGDENKQQSPDENCDTLINIPNADEKEVGTKIGIKNDIIQNFIRNISKKEEEKTENTNQKKKYIGIQPIEGSEDYYRITSEGEIDLIRKDEKIETESEDENEEPMEDFKDWSSQQDIMEIDDMLVLEILYHGGKIPRDEYVSGKKLRTVPEMIRNVEPSTDGLAKMKLSPELRKSLSEMLGIDITPEKKKYEEDEDLQKKPFKGLTKLIEEAHHRYAETYKKELKLELSEHELNLRKFVILGGVYNIDLIHQVPQPHKHKDGTVVQINYGDYNISKEEFFFKYVPPVATEEEENEEEDGKAKVDNELDKLVSVDIQVTESVLWFETPAPFLWDKDKKIWSSEDIYDTHFNEEKQILSFRIGKTSPIGIASFRYYNLPYQTWEIRPSSDWEESKSIIFSLTASTVVVEFLIKGITVSLNSVQNATGGALDNALGLPFPPNQLIRIMRQAGLDLFPGWDSFLYIEGNSSKKKVLEEHIYLSMALMAPSFQYTWSRWNMPAGNDRIIFQMREYNKPKDQENYKMVLNTTHRSVLVKCTEVSPSFTDDPAKDIGFQPDLFNLMQATVTDNAKKNAEKANTDVLFTLNQMLLNTKIFSYS